MAGASQHNGSDETLDSGGAADDDEEDILYANPRLRGTKLTVTWPVKCPVPCMVGNCKRNMKSGNYGS